MLIKNIFMWIVVLATSALLAIGRIYDERLSINEFNLALFISIVFLTIAFLLISNIKKIAFTKSKLLLYLFYLSILFSSPFLWYFFDYTEYGLEKFINFLLIVIPISIIVIEHYNVKYVTNTIYILLAVTFLLAILSTFGLFSSDRIDGRTATLGGGPIVFARWMGFGIITLFLFPNNLRNLYKYILILFFLILAFSTGSRGPVFSLLLTFLLYIFLNFNKIIIKLSFVIVLLTSIFFFTDLERNISNIGNVDRVFMNISNNGTNIKSTSTRKNLAEGSFMLIKNYPFGVGPGNWQTIANQIRPTKLMPLEYPHNLFLEVACEYGIHTLIILILLFIYIFYLSYNKMLSYNKNKSSLYPFLFYLLFFLSINSLISVMLTDSRLLFIVISFLLINKPLVKS